MYWDRHIFRSWNHKSPVLSAKCFVGFFKLQSQWRQMRNDFQESQITHYILPLSTWILSSKVVRLRSHKGCEKGSYKDIVLQWQAVIMLTSITKSTWWCPSFFRQREDLAIVQIVADCLLKKGSNGCVRAMVSSRASQNKKRKAKPDRTEQKGKNVV